jgi:hypothetical protein
MIRGRRSEQIWRRLRRLARGLADAIAAGRPQAATGGAATHARPSTATRARPSTTATRARPSTTATRAEPSTAAATGLPGAAAASPGRSSRNAYEAWLEECAGVREAYESWSTAPSADVRLAYAAYHAALDREEHASKYLQGLAT